MNRSFKRQAKVIAYAKTKAWRTTMQEAGSDRGLLWKLEKWARCRSFVPVDPPKLPSFTMPNGTASAHEDKGQALRAKFFPNPTIDVSDIQDTTFAPGADKLSGGFDITQEVTEEDVAAAVLNTKSWKAPGNDLLPTGFLKACGHPLYGVLAVLITQCFRLNFYPARFKEAKTVVLAKPGKTPGAYKTPGGYRPIALLPSLGKVIEAIIAGRITAAAELHELLPDEQMGNRQGRSTELAVRLVVTQVQEAWRQKATASLLQLDISGAFDTVNHTRLLDTLRDKGYPGWVIRWLKAWLQNRSASLHFDGRSTEPFPIYAGVPQGSPLSPILFVLYISSLYEVLKEKHPHLSLVGFADDTNLLAFGKTPEANIGQLEAAWQTCLMWAKTRGMSFAAEKCELIHFNKGRKQWQEAASLAQTGPGNRTIIRPMPASRFLGVWLDWKLSWKAHSEAVENKLKTQDFALSRIAAKTWGPGLIRAREVYTKCIRSAIAFGAASYHTPTRAEDKPKGITASLYKAQNRSLRIVAGAYRATPIRSLETETWVPPLDLYLNKRLADFEARLAAPLPGAHSTNNSPTSTPSTSGSSTSIPKSGNTIIQQACSRLARRFQGRRRTRRRVQRPKEPIAVEKAAMIVEAWASQGRTTKEALEISWEARWKQNFAARRPGTRSSRVVQPADERPLFADKILKLHKNLTKAESSLLVQIRTGVIGLKEFLFRIGTRGVATPYCTCGTGKETVEHLVIWCPNPPGPRPWNTSDIRSKKDLHQALHGGDKGNDMSLARAIVGWLLRSGILPEYRLAAKLQLESGNPEDQG